MTQTDVGVNVRLPTHRVCAGQVTWLRAFHCGRLFEHDVEVVHEILACIRSRVLASLAKICLLVSVAGGCADGATSDAGSSNGSFHDTLEVGTSELWVAGNSLSGSVSFSFANGACIFREMSSGREVKVVPHTAGLERLFDGFWMRLRTGGLDSATVLLRESNLVASAEVSADSTTVAIRFHGHPGDYHLRVHPSAPREPRVQSGAGASLASAERRVKLFQSRMNEMKVKLGVLPSGLLVYVTSCGQVKYFANQAHRSAKAQIQHVVAGGVVDDAPSGPLMRAQLREIARVHSQ